MQYHAANRRTGAALYNIQQDRLEVVLVVIVVMVVGRHVIGATVAQAHLVDICHFRSLKPENAQGICYTMRNSVAGNASFFQC